MGITWELFGSADVDIDGTIVMLDDCGATIDAVFYNKLRSDDKSI